MDVVKICLATAVLTVAGACTSTKKSASSSEVKTTTSTETVTSDNSYLFNKPTGIKVPGNEDLSAIQLRYPDVTLQKLSEGHVIYSQGACVSCHAAQSIYNYGEEQWKKIIDDMSFRANISDEQKDAVYKYVMAMKATQPK
ncbi:MAG: hypothetical protein K0Q95_2817 [Bacteroidota bacterium]|jgi:cytochrome c551/c552|nr:hypothetical protein [Bacteroidota bacterium]